MKNSGVLELVYVLIGKGSVFCIMWPTENQLRMEKKIAILLIGTTFKM